MGLLSSYLLLVLCFQCIKIEACTSCGISCLKLFYFLFFACVCVSLFVSDCCVDSDIVSTLGEQISRSVCSLMNPSKYA